VEEGWRRGGGGVEEGWRRGGGERRTIGGGGCGRSCLVLFAQGAPRRPPRRAALPAGDGASVHSVVHAPFRVGVRGRVRVAVRVRVRVAVAVRVRVWG
jgi:hypothetical protein